MKSSRTPPFLKRSLFAFGFMLVLLGVTGCFFVVNTTRSFPLGVYFKTHGPVHKGDLVLFCPEENMVARYGRARGLISYGVCPGRYGYLIKRVMAPEGDEVNLSDAGVSVNGIYLPNSQRQKAFPAFSGSLVLHNQVLLMSEHPLSFDSRYFGFVRVEKICTPLKPFILWE